MPETKDTPATEPLDLEEVATPDEYDVFKASKQRENVIEKLNLLRQQFIGVDEGKFRRLDNAYAALTLL